MWKLVSGQMCSSILKSQSAWADVKTFSIFDYFTENKYIMSCCIYNCSNNNKRIPKKHFFTIPKDNAEAYWMISKVRKFATMTKEKFMSDGYKNMRCCEDHFDPEDIYTDPTRKRKGLHYGAIPKRVRRYDFQVSTTHLFILIALTADILAKLRLGRSVAQQCTNWWVELCKKVVRLCSMG